MGARPAAERLAACSWSRGRAPNPCGLEPQPQPPAGSRPMLDTFAPYLARTLRAGIAGDTATDPKSAEYRVPAKEGIPTQTCAVGAVSEGKLPRKLPRKLPSPEACES